VVSVVITGANDAVAMTSGPGSASLAEQPGVTGSTSLDTTSPDPTGALNFADVDLSDVHSIGVTLNSAVWSASSGFVPADTIGALQTALITALHDSTGTGSGAVDWTFSIRRLESRLPQRRRDADGDLRCHGLRRIDQFDPAGEHRDRRCGGSVHRDTGDGSCHGHGQYGRWSASRRRYDRRHCPRRRFEHPAHDYRVNGSAANVGTLVAGAYGSLVLNADGTYAYVANAAIDPLQVGSNPTDQFTFQVDDGQGNTTTTTLTFNITGADDRPIITAADVLATLTEDAGPSVAVNGGFETGNLSGWIANGVTVDRRLPAANSAIIPRGCSGRVSWNRMWSPRPASTIR
jgi:VCBS repeat-containing protein